MRVLLHQSCDQILDMGSYKMLIKVLIQDEKDPQKDGGKTAVVRCTLGVKKCHL